MTPELESIMFIRLTQCDSHGTPSSKPGMLINVARIECVREMYGPGAYIRVGSDSLHVVESFEQVVAAIVAATTPATLNVVTLREELELAR